MVIQSFSSLKNDPSDILSNENMEKLKERQVGNKVIRIGELLENIPSQQLQSPSRNKADLMLLPGMSQMNAEDINFEFMEN